MKLSKALITITFLVLLNATFSFSASPNPGHDLYLEGFELYKKGEINKAGQILSQASKQGSAEAAYLIGLLLYSGPPPERGSKTDKVAADAYARAIKLGMKYHNNKVVRGAANMLAKMFLRGHGVSKDTSRAIKMFFLGAEKGDASSQAFIGFCYFMGVHGLKVDYIKADTWLQKAAEQGSQEAFLYLGMFNDMNGRELVAKENLLKCINLPECQRTLGLIYLSERALFDIDEAEKLLRKAAAKGDKHAIEALNNIDFQTLKKDQ